MLCIELLFFSWANFRTRVLEHHLIHQKSVKWKCFETSPSAVTRLSDPAFTNRLSGCWTLSRYLEASRLEVYRFYFFCFTQKQKFYFSIYFLAWLLFLQSKSGGIYETQKFYVDPNSSAAQNVNACGAFFPATPNIMQKISSQSPSFLSRMLCYKWIKSVA